MLFNSIEFAIFLPVVFFLYWAIGRKKIRLQNGFLIAASYLFYGWWDWRFLSLIIISSAVDYFVGIALSNEKEKSKRKLLLFTSLIVNLGFLGFFKYFNFFADNFAQAFTLFGMQFDPVRLNIVLPVGISFYTFQTLSYSIDVYRGQMPAKKDPLAFFAFVSFFPQLVAGPIERAANLLPQFLKERKFDYKSAVDGMRQILWGLFKKIVIADNCAVYVDQIFGNNTDFSGSTLMLGAVFFAFQIYGDFSGYSDIAIGTAKLFGFNLMRNFAFPYFSRDIAEFWRRWHISLSTWFRDYLYIPLGGSRCGTGMKVRNTFIIFIVSGFWHGANWTFIVWGALNAIYFMPLLLAKKNRIHTGNAAEGRILPNLKEVLQISFTFFITNIAWVFFRAESVSHALEYLGGIFSPDFFTIPEFLPLELFIFIGIMLVSEWLQRNRQHPLEFNGMKIPVYLRYAVYYGITLIIFLFGGSQQQFIYFQF